MPSVGFSLAIVTAAASTCFVPDLRSVLITCFKGLFPVFVVSQLFTKSARGDGGDSALAVAEVHPRNGRSGGRAARNVIRDDTRLLDDVAPVLRTTATERRTISNLRNRPAGGTPPQRAPGEFS